MKFQSLSLRYPVSAFRFAAVFLCVLCASLSVQAQVTGISKIMAAPNYAAVHVTATTTAGTLRARNSKARATLIQNQDASITVYIGAPTVTSSNGIKLLAGQSVVVNTTALIQVIAASGSPVVAYWDEYD